MTNSFNIIKILLLLLSSIIVTPTIALENGPKIHTLYIATAPLSPPPPPPLPPMTQLKPSMAVIVAVLTTMFSITFLLLLYAKHCKRGDNGSNDVSELYSSGGAPAKNSGVDRKIIESLPVFRFGVLMGEKEGLECAVCLGRFEQTEVLRLLPKCKHAFHVECVDTWLEAHSTCPLCRYRVDPEDILLVGRDAAPHTDTAAASNRSNGVCPPPPPFRRVSGRHSSAGEGGSRSSVGTAPNAASSALQIVIDLPGRRSFDSWRTKRERKDEALLIEGGDRSDRVRKLEHQIVIGGSGKGLEKRWSDVQPSDLLYLRSEMIMSDNRRYSSSSAISSRLSKHVTNNCNSNSNIINICNNNNNNNNSYNERGGRVVINERSVSEITGLSRFGKTTSQQGVLLSRWMAWVPHRQS